MKRCMQIFTVIGLLVTAAAIVGYQISGAGFLLSLAITGGTLCFHLLMRFAVGTAVDLIFHQQINPTRAWFRPRAWEEKLYRRLRVEAWKGKVPTYNPTLFSHDRHTWREIAASGASAELIHELIALFSFLPLFAIIWFGAPWVFLITSCLAALYDLRFVVLLRSNRPRLLRVAAREERYSPSKLQEKG